MKHSKAPPKPELLAPCGSLEAFFAALESGADAVYAGLREFSARARAKNFTLSQLERMLAYARQHGRRIYVTLNTLVKERELPQLVETLAELARLRADGVIVQDMAVARLVRHYFPSLPLHASTQMTIHNLAGVRFLERLGFERVVLARELHLTDLKQIAASCRAEIEVFVHGALCFCISGQCHFSSWLGGHSGNRGRCAQPCRRLYSHRNKQGYYFSPNDLSAIELVPELAAAGVRSLKIEGRMKSADYVAKVVSAYRLMLDAAPDDQRQALATARELLKGSFGRSPTKGFLSSTEPNDIANPWLRGGTGRFTGVVKRVAAGRISFETRDSIRVGDRLRLQPKSDMAGQAWTVRELYQGRKKVHSCAAHSLVEVVCPFPATPGDALFKVASHDAFGMSDEAAIRKLQSAGPDRTAVALVLACHQTGENWTLQITAQLGATTFSYEFALGPLEPARSADLTGVLTARFNETGETPFFLTRLEAPDFPAVFIPPARLKEIRRELYRRLEQDGISAQRALLTEAKGRALAGIHHAQQPRAVAQNQREELLLIVESPAEVRWALSQADRVVLPLRKATVHALPRYLGRLREVAQKIIWQLPFILFEADYDWYRRLTQHLYAEGFRQFEVTNPCHFMLLEELNDLRISCGYRLFSLNTQALLSWQELHAERATLYLEDERENIAALIGAGLAITPTVTVYAPIEVMTTRIKIKEASGSAPFLSDRGEGYRLRGRDGLSVISATTPFSLLGHLAELRRIGCRSFQMDLTETEPALRDHLVAAFRADRPVQDTTTFNYERGLV